MKRLRFEVRDWDGSWYLFHGEHAICGDWKKPPIVRRAAALLRDLLGNYGIRSELVIKDRKGRIQDTRTYGDDPRRTRG